MKLRKADEMEQSHNLKAAKNAFTFYSAALLLWGIYDFITTGHYGLGFTILLVVQKYFIQTNGNRRGQSKNTNKSNLMDNFLFSYISLYHSHS